MMRLNKQNNLNEPGYPEPVVFELKAYADDESPVRLLISKSLEEEEGEKGAYCFTAILDFSWDETQAMHEWLGERLKKREIAK
jgi:hypothetical protein